MQPLISTRPGTGGRLKSEPEDFVVEELPAYPASGSGEHLFLYIEKRDLDTEAAARRLCEALGVDAREAGWAGRKDRRAVTRQTISVPGVAPERAAGLELPGVRVLAAARHPHKLRLGHLRGNRFELVLREVAPGALEHARGTLEELRAAGGLPNFYGEQRFGADGDNAAVGRRILAAGRRGKFGRRERFLLSALQSALFNDVLVRRIAGGSWRRALLGDVLRKRETGGIFVCAEPELDTARVLAGEVDPTGPIFGGRMRAAEHEAALVEAAALEAAGLTPGDFEALGKRAPGTRRPLRVPVGDASVEEVPGGLRLRFTLPPGSYATVLLQEVTKNAIVDEEQALPTVE